MGTDHLKVYVDKLLRSRAAEMHGVAKSTRAEFPGDPDMERMAASFAAAGNMFALGVEAAPPALELLGLPGAHQEGRRAERQALDALHVWLHCASGDAELIEAAADFHELQTVPACVAAERAAVEQDPHTMVEFAENADAFPEGVQPVPGPRVLVAVLGEPGAARLTLDLDWANEFGRHIWLMDGHGNQSEPPVIALSAGDRFQVCIRQVKP